MIAAAFFQILMKFVAYFVLR